MAGQEIAPLYWFLHEPYTGARHSVIPLTIGGQRNFAFFCSEESLWNFVDRFANGRQHPITGDPITQDSIVVDRSNNVEVLLELCERLYIDEAISGFYIDPDPPPATPTPMELAAIKDQIQAMPTEDSPGPCQ